MKFVRRLAHVVSMIALLLVAGCAAASELHHSKNGEADSRRDPQRAIGLAIHQSKSTYEAAQGGSGQGNPTNVNVLSVPEVSVKRDGVQIGLTVAWIVVTLLGAGAATGAFLSDRKAVRLTQRADVLVESIGIDPAPVGQPYKDIIAYSLALNAQVIVRLKNFGPTRASDVHWDVVPIIEGIKAKEPKDPPTLPTVVIAAGGDISPRTGPLNAYFDNAVMNDVSGAKTKLTIKITMDYLDVFGKRHKTVEQATYFNGRFIVDAPVQAD